MAPGDALGLEWTVFEDVGFVDDLVTDGGRFVAVGQTSEGRHWLAAWDASEGLRELEFSDPSVVQAVLGATLSGERVGAAVLPVDEVGQEAVVALGTTQEPLELHVLPRPPEPRLVSAGAELVVFDELGVVVRGSGVVAPATSNTSVALRWFLSDGVWSVAVVEPLGERPSPAPPLHRVAEGQFGALRVLSTDDRHRLVLETASGEVRTAAPGDLPGATEPGWWYGVGNAVGVLDDGIVVSMVEVPPEGEGEGVEGPPRRWVLLVGRQPGVP